MSPEEIEAAKRQIPFVPTPEQITRLREEGLMPKRVGVLDR